MAIETLAQLEGVVGKKPPARDLKVLDHTDATAQTWLSHSRATIACVGAARGAVVSVPGLMQRGLDKDYDTNLY